MGALSCLCDVKHLDADRRGIRSVAWISLSAERSNPTVGRAAQQRTSAAVFKRSAARRRSSLPGRACGSEARLLAAGCKMAVITTPTMYPADLRS